MHLSIAANLLTIVIRDAVSSTDVKARVASHGLILVSACIVRPSLARGQSFFFLSFPRCPCGCSRPHLLTTHPRPGPRKVLHAQVKVHLHYPYTTA
ncbi:hypothetical protein QBC33DRAFT_529195 [Phialemonium atrogriseum]|uniref:Uncharacterized protein n=1 Tax=Phialemonium atrogriseum TaxID=1093897 RepID=A0AAJ0FJE3_9PEZI|nr:uncharacterized protein QBC33DRAFT_529195 [Phialemonium atrogriseum]KAK1769812.1 hypothetical protein QBC33DRAFT_529195 [Phialemonium atrogriseum]